MKSISKKALGADASGEDKVAEAIAQMGNLSGEAKEKPGGHRNSVGAKVYVAEDKPLGQRASVNAGVKVAPLEDK